MTPKQDMAQERTDWAEDRTLLAAERTFAGWVRTGLTTIVVALGLQAVFGPFEPTWAPKAVATLFLAVALGIFLAAWIEARGTLRRLDSHSATSQSRWQITLLSVSLSLATMGTGAVLWLL